MPVNRFFFSFSDKIKIIEAFLLPKTSPVTEIFPPKTGRRFDILRLGTEDMFHCLVFEKGGKTFVHPAVAGLIVCQQTIEPLVGNFVNNGCA